MSDDEIGDSDIVLTVIGKYIKLSQCSIIGSILIFPVHVLDCGN